MNGDVRATRLRVGDCAAVHSDGGPGAGCGDVCCDGACVLRFRCWFAHYPCSELRKPCITPIKASEQTTDLHRSLGTPRGGPLCNVAGAHRVAAADEETPMQLLKLCYPNIPPPSYLNFSDSQARRTSKKEPTRRDQEAEVCCCFSLGAEKNQQGHQVCCC